MADTKISALPSATTPVAGSEVLPIVQSGATTKVSIDNLTTGKNVPMLGVAATGLSALGSALNANWASASKGAQLGTYGAVYQLEIDATVALASNALVSNASTGATKYIASAAASRVSAGVGTLSLDIALAGTAGAVIGANWASALSTNTTYNVTLPSGNLVIGTSGKGIDFSATPGTGTSELFSDYEEGTFTPTMTSALGSVTVNTANGTYTKMGNLVRLEMKIDYSTDVSVLTSNITIGAFPFTSKSTYYSKGFVILSNWTASDVTDGYLTLGPSATSMLWQGRSVNQSSRTNAILYFETTYLV